MTTLSSSPVESLLNNLVLDLCGPDPFISMASSWGYNLIVDELYGCTEFLRFAEGLSSSFLILCSFQMHVDSFESFITNSMNERMNHPNFAVSL